MSNIYGRTQVHDSASNPAAAGALRKMKKLYWGGGKIDLFSVVADPGNVRRAIVSLRMTLR